MYPVRNRADQLLEDALTRIDHLREELGRVRDTLLEFRFLNDNDDSDNTHPAGIDLNEPPPPPGEADND